ncbi:hypothetical protein D1155_09220 [Anaerotruncus sp. 80]|uniref:Peptidase n=1 Tax=Anaerotruncus colihominis TaxID=169435 RepID=A0A845QI75_9FIRM|nr:MULTISPECIES: VWA-like domain-containing protein [Anaerotruncus]NBH61830.1 hypothetical protein [Anaerotruncus colihominis]NCF02485.1 hypothetical protein [Anaerotruncus sp. 80]
MATNTIVEYLYRIKDNITAVENGIIEDAILNEIENDFHEFMELIKLFLISERDSYYGYFMMNLSFKVDFYSNTIAGIKLNVYPLVMVSNPLLLCKLTLKEIIFIICHEIEHIILNHPSEMVKCNPMGDEKTHAKFNLAADASVNGRLRYEIKAEHRLFMTVWEKCILPETLKKMFGLRTVAPLESYYYYYRLIEEKDLPDGKENGIGADSDEFITEGKCDRYEDHNWEAGDDVDEITAIVGEFINAAAEMMDDETRKLMPAYFLEQVRRVNEPAKLSWKKILKKYIGTIAAGKRKTKARLNRRQPERYDLSGEINDKILKIVVAIDTSASVTGRELSLIFNELFSILSKKNYCITVIECDSEIQRIYTVKQPSDVKYDVAGRGGTAFTPVIEYVNRNKYYRDSLLIYFTDGYGENKIPKPLTYRNLWVITGSRRELSLKNPYGAVIGFEEGEN